MHRRLLNWAATVTGASRGSGAASATDAVCTAMEMAKLGLPTDKSDPHTEDYYQDKRLADIHDGWMVERCISGLSFPRKEQGMLRDYYVWALPDLRVARNAHIPLSKFGEKMLDAVSICKNRLAILERRVYKTSSQLVPPPADPGRVNGLAAIAGRGVAAETTEAT